MMLALMLAQLVLPWPGLDSPLVQPGPTICVGECAGPVVWGPADRGRLVVACDMRSDTCSDGRQMTTTRATPVPCETSPGVWEIVPANVGCYSVRGLESWVATTSYLSYGAELDRSPWIATGGGTITPLVRGYRLSGPVGSNVVQNLGNADADTEFTFACILRGEGQARLQFGGTQVMDLSADWRLYSRTVTISQGAVIAPRVYTGNGSTTNDPVDIMGCWLTRSATPGRPCWGGEAPVTCDGDRHTVSTEGWPTESGEISLVYTPQDVGIGSAMYLAATTAGGANQPSGFYLYRISASGALVFGLRRGDTLSGQSTQDLAWENGRSYHVRVRWSPERAEIFRDGVRLRSWVPTTVPDSHPVTAFIGTNTIGTSPAQGSISSLTVRSYEEVSP